MTLEEFLVELEPWRADAECRARGMARSVFYPERGSATAVYELLRPVCRACPVRVECLESILAYERGAGPTFRFGFLGGKTPRERWREHVRRSRAAA